MGEFAGVLSGHLNARAGPFWAPWRARLGHCAPAPNSVVASDLDRAKAKTPPELPGGVACADGWFEARRKPRCRAKDPREELGAVLNGTGRSNLVILRQLFAMLRQVGSHAGRLMLSQLHRQKPTELSRRRSSTYGAGNSTNGREGGCGGDRRQVCTVLKWRS
jgi:hypothetical protein